MRLQLVGGVSHPFDVEDLMIFTDTDIAPPYGNKEIGYTCVHQSFLASIPDCLP